MQKSLVGSEGYVQENLWSWLVQGVVMFSDSRHSKHAVSWPFVYPCILSPPLSTVTLQCSNSLAYFTRHHLPLL